VLRNGKHVTLQAKVAELKEEQLASARGNDSPGESWGVQVQEITPEVAQQLNLQNTKGVVIRGVRPDSVAAEAGLQAGDVVLEVDHKKVNNVDDFLGSAKQDQKNKKSALLLVQRGNSTIYTVINPEG
jgi:serine protease Do